MIGEGEVSANFWVVLGFFAALTVTATIALLRKLRGEPLGEDPGLRGNRLWQTAPMAIIGGWTMVVGGLVMPFIRSDAAAADGLQVPAWFAVPWMTLFFGSLILSLSIYHSGHPRFLVPRRFLE